MDEQRYVSCWPDRPSLGRGNGDFRGANTLAGCSPGYGNVREVNRLAEESRSAYTRGENSTYSTSTTYGLLYFIWSYQGNAHLRSVGDGMSASAEMLTDEVLP